MKKRKLEMRSVFGSDEGAIPVLDSLTFSDLVITPTFSEPLPNKDLSSNESEEIKKPKLTENEKKRKKGKEKDLADTEVPSELNLTVTFHGSHVFKGLKRCLEYDIATEFPKWISESPHFGANSVSLKRKRALVNEEDSHLSLPLPEKISLFNH